MNDPEELTRPELIRLVKELEAKIRRTEKDLAYYISLAQSYREILFDEDRKKDYWGV